MKKGYREEIRGHGLVIDIAKGDEAEDNGNVADGRRFIGKGQQARLPHAKI